MCTNFLKDFRIHVCAYVFLNNYFLQCWLVINDIVLKILFFFFGLILQVETIGDAYCVASGLHKYSSIHAQQIAWMALRMIETCKTHHTHDGQPIRVNLTIYNRFYFVSQKWLTVVLLQNTLLCSWCHRTLTYKILSAQNLKTIGPAPDIHI